MSDTANHAQQVRSLIAERTKAYRYRRHPAEVTADRLRDALDKWPDQFDGAARDAIGLLIFTLEQIAAPVAGGSA